MPAVSAVIITKDEAERLEPCVTSCRGFAAEVVVVDGGSSDDTVEVARRLGCAVFENPWPGFGAQRNFGAARAASDWIFWIDADEVVGSELAAALRLWSEGSDDGPRKLTVERTGDFMGRWLFGASERLVRLYDRRVCSITEVPVHEEVTGPSASGALEGRLWHFGFRSLSDHVKRFDAYTTLEAEKAWEAGRRYSRLRLLWRPPARLFHTLFRRGMYREGAVGLAVTALWVQYEIMRELKLRERAWRESGSRHEPAV